VEKGHTEVQHFYPKHFSWGEVGCVQEDVFGLEVAVHDANTVRCSERVPYLTHHHGGVGEGERSPGETCAEVFSTKEFHGNPGDSGRGVDTRGDHLDDVGAVDPSCDVGFSFEACAQAGFGHERRVHDLEGARFPCRPLLDEVDRSHAPFAEEANDLEIFRDERSGFERRVCLKH
jgi:hypothetical protein